MVELSMLDALLFIEIEHNLPYQPDVSKIKDVDSNIEEYLSASLVYLNNAHV
jgi:hypothetical protein